MSWRDLVAAAEAACALVAAGGAACATERARTRLPLDSSMLKANELLCRFLRETEDMLASRRDASREEAPLVTLALKLTPERDEPGVPGGGGGADGAVIETESGRLLRQSDTSDASVSRSDFW